MPEAAPITTAVFPVKNGLFDLTGKTAVVIGAASGIGEAVALGCARQGARVVCLDVNEEAARRVAAQATAEGGRCEAGVVDIRHGAAVHPPFHHGNPNYRLAIPICTP